MIFNMTGGGGASKMPEFTYTGDYTLIDDGKVGSTQNWRIKFLTSGTLRFTKLYGNVIDVFCVSGGMAGNYGGSAGGGGGGGGPTKTAYSIIVQENVDYLIVVGAGGEGRNSSPYTGLPGGFSSAFGVQAAQTVVPSSWSYGGSGASGGGGYSNNGGTDGEDGNGNSTYPGGTGQHSTTREFETEVTNAYIVGSTPFAANWLSLSVDGSALSPDENTIYSVLTRGTSSDPDQYVGYWYHDYVWDGTKYVETDVACVYGSGGGAALKANGTSNYGGARGGGHGMFYNSANRPTSGEPNTGGGGGGGYTVAGSPGGSGIVVIRNHREVAA